MAASDAIVPGSFVRMHYALKLEDGSVIESSFDAEPIEIVVGDGTLIAGFERAIYGLRAGAQQTLRIGPSEGYGMPDPERVFTLDAASFPENIPQDVGVVVSFELPSGEEVPGMIVDVRDGKVSVDFNHPLAGHEVTFDVEILDVHTPVANEE